MIKKKKLKQVLKNTKLPYEIDNISKFHKRANNKKIKRKIKIEISINI